MDDFKFLDKDGEEPASFGRKRGGKFNKRKVNRFNTLFSLSNTLMYYEFMSFQFLMCLTMYCLFFADKALTGSFCCFTAPILLPSYD